MASRGWQDVSAADIARMQRKDAPAVKPSKYRNVKIQTPDGEFDSKKEYHHWLTLKAREHAGEISVLSRQFEYELRCPIDSEAPGASAVVAVYRADFRFFDEREQRWCVQDVKGGTATRTSLFALKAKWLNLQDGIVIELV